MQDISKIEIKTSKGSYTVKFLEKSQLPDCNIAVADVAVASSLNFAKKVISVHTTESKKNLDTCNFLIEELARLGLKKKERLTVVGGGFVQDIGTLIASLYMRGIDWIYIPTTLAAMGDSCIGGKSSINSQNYKNIIGNFYPPIEVLICPEFLESLPISELIAGYSEIVKIIYAHNPSEITNINQLIRSSQSLKNRELLVSLISNSLKCKKLFVEEDEFDIGRRQLLNFGHTFGHAIESATTFRVRHGVAVLVGMLMAIGHPLAQPAAKSRELKDLIFFLLSNLPRELAVLRNSFNSSLFEEAITRDKKNTIDALVMVLPINDNLRLVQHRFLDDAIRIVNITATSVLAEVSNEIR